MEDQIRNFYAEASKGYSKKTMSNIAKFRKFIHRNQNADFTDRDRSKLFSIVELYFSQLHRQEHKVTQTNESAQGLIEDALKMPASMFNQKQKKTFLKWLDEVVGKEASTDQNKHSKKYTNDEEDEYDEDYDYAEEDPE